MKKEQVISATIFWSAFVTLLAVCCFFMVHNAAWLFGDEAIVYGTTGMGKAFSPLGFDGMIDSYGRFYPFAYNLYNVLLLFGDGQISAEAHYILQAVALCILATCLAFAGLHILKNYSAAWKYSITFCFVAIAVFRVYPEFVTCYTGMWIVFMLLAVFILSTCKFEETEHWGWGIPAILAVTYICYCYENICVIPVVYGACSLLFNYKNLSQNKKWFNGLLVASGLLFLFLYAVIVLPRATHFYGHHTETSIFYNAFRLFIAHKIYWVAIIFLCIRIWDVFRNKKPYLYADSFLLAAFAYFCGTAFLHLDFVYYYNVGVLLALTAILCYSKEYLKPHWAFLLMLALCAFYGRKMPSNIKKNQQARINSSTQITKLANYVQEGVNLYWYAPEYEDSTEFLLDLRSCSRYSTRTYIEWYLQKDIEIAEQSTFDTNLSGIWLNPDQNNKLFPESDSIFSGLDTVYHAGSATGYLIK